MSSKSILKNYRVELKTALKWKAEGRTSVSADVAGTPTAISIDDYIAHWQKGIAEMEAGADQTLYNY